MILFLLSVFSVIPINAKDFVAKVTRYCINYGNGFSNWKSCQKTCTLTDYPTTRWIIQSNPTRTIYVNNWYQKSDLQGTGIWYQGQDNNGKGCRARLYKRDDDGRLELYLIYTNKTICYDLDANSME